MKNHLSHTLLTIAFLSSITANFTALSFSSSCQYQGCEIQLKNKTHEDMQVKVNLTDPACQFEGMEPPLEPNTLTKNESGNYFFSCDKNQLILLYRISQDTAPRY